MVMRICSWLTALCMVAGCSKPEDTVIAKAEETIRHQLKDPQSATFRNVEKCPEGNIVVGEVNGKNSFGAYVGFRSFAIVNGAPFLQSGEHAWEELYMIKVGNACYKGGNAKLDEFINQSDPQVFTDEEFARDQIMSEISDTVNAANASKSAVGK